MKGLKKILLLLLTLSLVMTSLYSTGWAGEKLEKDDPMAHGWGAMDLILARPIGVLAACTGSFIFVITLPFTIPSRGVGNAAHMFIVQPLQFSFTREFPDENI